MGPTIGDGSIHFFLQKCGQITGEPPFDRKASRTIESDGVIVVDIAIGDINGDRRNDLIIAGENDTIGIYLAR